MKQNEAEILNYLKRATAPVYRSELCAVMGMSDRNVRHAIQRLREQGYRIISNPDTAGYWMAKDKKELDEFIAVYTAYARQIIDTARKMQLSKKKYGK